MAIDTAILLIAWRRPHTTRQVLDAIRAAAPSRLYVACDGPRAGNDDEARNVAATRQLIDDAIDWPCTVSRRYVDSNQGCRIGVSNAITWFFEHEPEGIILEDDCVPHPDFFPFCEQLLDRYRHDTRIWMISGNNFQDGQWRGDGSYYFSMYPHIWGWATWRRTWEEYDRDLDSWPHLRGTSLARHLVSNPRHAKMLFRRWDDLRNKQKPDTWDYQFQYGLLVSSRLAVLPNRNLVANVGFGADATHTTSHDTFPFDRAGILPLRPPTFVLRDVAADGYSYRKLYAPRPGVFTRLIDAFGRLLFPAR